MNPGSKWANVSEAEERIRLCVANGWHFFLGVGPQEAVGMTEGEELTHGIRRHCGGRGRWWRQKVRIPRVSWHKVDSLP